MIVDYLGHSAFLVETARALLLFDCTGGDYGLLEGKPAEKPLFVFISHAHEDHFDPRVFSLGRGGRRARFLLSFDLRENPGVPAGADVLWLDPGQTLDVPGLGRVKTLLSNDEGVAFWVDCGGEDTFFHAGDLNWWDWEGEDPDWLREEERIFKEEIGKLAGAAPKAACLVLDDRLEKNAEKGIRYVLGVCSPTCVFPMHFWQDREAPGRLKRELALEGSGVRILDTAKENHWEI